MTPADLAGWTKSQMVIIAHEGKVKTGRQSALIGTAKPAKVRVFHSLSAALGRPTPQAIEADRQAKAKRKRKRQAKANASQRPVATRNA